MALIGTLKRSREAFLDRTADEWPARFFSAATYSLWDICAEATVRNCSGRVLDAGSGRGTWRRTILRATADYESIDIAPRGGDRPTWIGDITAMPQVPDGHYSTVVCHQVLEHVRKPWSAVEEFHRVLKPGGVAVVSVPHLSRRHELPHDYFRFTQEGLVSLLQSAGFTDIEVQPFGSVLSLLHHQVSFFFPGLLCGIPVLGTAAQLVNAPFSWLLSGLDRLLDRPALMPLGVLAIARKPSGPSASGAHEPAARAQ